LRAQNKIKKKKHTQLFLVHGFPFPKASKIGGFWNPKDSMVYGYGKYKISNPSGKRQGTDTQ